MSYIRHCDVCKEYNPDINHVVRISDDKNYHEINGHEDCINKLHTKLKSLDIDKLSVDKVIKLIKIN